MKRTSIFLADEDFEAIKIIQRRYGVSTASDAIRLAVRLLASQETEIKLNSKKRAANC